MSATCPSASSEDIQPVPRLYFVKMSPHALPPLRASQGAAGYDLFSAYDITVPAHGRAVVPTDLMLHFPEGCYGRIAPRSGLATKFFIDVGAGVIDPDYRGNVSVVLFNFADSSFSIRRGDRIAQLILERMCVPELAELADLDWTQRGADGFGSTGLSQDPSQRSVLEWLTAPSSRS
ncbi:ORF1 [turkey adenovirus 5]|uniref:dUTP diphosphatase n=1 Tax=turkey adenovirus 5 TaxID=1408258 RepID=U5NED4_9ADEN|nr:dUTPase [Turkey aviadenovirus 5]AGX93325.1 ORF1 [Turkey aviadenovirus 5]